MSTLLLNVSISILIYFTEFFYFLFHIPKTSIHYYIYLHIDYFFIHSKSIIEELHLKLVDPHPNFIIITDF